SRVWLSGETANETCRMAPSALRSPGCFLADFLERRIARAGAEARWHLHGMDEGHSEDPGVEIDGHLRVVGVEREMMHATEADRALGTGVAAILELNIVMEPPLDRWRLGQCKSLAQHRLSSVS